METKIKVFISQPMKDLSEEEIIQTRSCIIRKLEKLYGLHVDVIPSYCKEPPKFKHTGLWCLGMSLKLMAEADVVIAADGWNKARGCILECSAARSYGLQVIYEEDLDEELEH